MLPHRTLSCELLLLRVVDPAESPSRVSATRDTKWRFPGDVETGRGLYTRSCPTRPSWPTRSRRPTPRWVRLLLVSSTALPKLALYERNSTNSPSRGPKGQCGLRVPRHGLDRFDTVPDNPDRRRCEAAFAHLAPMAP